MRKPAMIAVLLLGLGAMVPAHAEEDAQQGAAQESAAQQPVVAARDWLELQSSGAAASSQPQPLSGAAMDKVHERYVKSFGHPLPIHFEREPVTAE